VIEVDIATSVAAITSCRAVVAGASVEGWHRRIRKAVDGSAIQYIVLGSSVDHRIAHGVACNSLVSHVCDDSIDPSVAVERSGIGRRRR
jgi:hypothetical protein